MAALGGNLTARRRFYSPPPVEDRPFHFAIFYPFSTPGSVGTAYWPGSGARKSPGNQQWPARVSPRVGGRHRPVPDYPVQAGPRQHQFTHRHDTDTHVPPSVDATARLRPVAGGGFAT